MTTGPSSAENSPEKGDPRYIALTRVIRANNTQSFQREPGTHTPRKIEGRMKLLKPNRLTGSAHCATGRRVSERKEGKKLMRLKGRGTASVKHQQNGCEDSPSQEDEEDDAQRPNVAGLVVALALEHFGCHEVGRVAGCHEQAIFGPELLGEAKVDDPQRFGGHALRFVQDV
ncbi:hypothetical protein FOCC_FOCC010783 [Frankliniella occidentalis]|nr:hypothetical protein FOCC_FOCC010783 [Frankliniella occidentalis]